MSYVDHAHRHLPGGSDALRFNPRFTYILFGPDVPVTANASANDVECENFSLPSDLDGMAIVKVEGFVTTPSSAGDVEIDVHCFFPDRGGAGVSVFDAGTTLVIDAGEYTSIGSDPPLYTGSPFSAFETFSTDNFIVMQVVDEGTDTTGLGLHITFGPATA